MKVHEKTTYLTRMAAKTTKMIKGTNENDDDILLTDGIDGVKDDPEFTLAVTKGLPSIYT